MEQKIRIGRSKIQGRGVFATKVIYLGEVIDDKVVRGTGFNFSCDPNVMICRVDGDYRYVAALRKISRGEELTVLRGRVDAKNLTKFTPMPGGSWCNCQVCAKRKPDEKRVSKK